MCVLRDRVIRVFLFQDGDKGSKDYNSGRQSLDKGFKSGQFTIGGQFAIGTS